MNEPNVIRLEPKNRKFTHSYTFTFTERRKKPSDVSAYSKVTLCQFMRKVCRCTSYDNNTEK